jgi:predicted DCC family thiol-disulfide oxidoreductase YuxK
MQGEGKRSENWEAWVLYDGDCGFCSRWVGFWRPTLERRGITIAALQEPWVVERLQLPISNLLADIVLLSRSGALVSGANVYLQVTRRIWWAWPFYAVFSLPGFNRLIHIGYRWFARNRYCVSRACRLDQAGKTP